MKNQKDKNERMFRLLYLSFGVLIFFILCSISFVLVSSEGVSIPIKILGSTQLGEISSDYISQITASTYSTTDLNNQIKNLVDYNEGKITPVAGDPTPNKKQTEGYFNSIITKSTPEQFNKIVEKLDATNKASLYSYLTSSNRDLLISKLTAENNMKLFNSVEGKTDSASKSIQGDILGRAYKSQFGNEVKVGNLPAGMKLSMEKKSDGKINSLKLQFTKDGKTNGEITLNKNIKSIGVSGMVGFPSDYSNLVLEQKTGSNKDKIQLFDISPGLSMNEKLQFSYEGITKNIQAGFGEREGNMKFELITGADKKNNLQVTMIDETPQTYNTVDDMKNDLANIPSILIGDAESGYAFVQPQGEAGKNGLASFSVDSSGKMTINEGRVRFAVPTDDLQSLSYSLAMGSGESISINRNQGINTALDLRTLNSPANEITIGKNGLVVNNNNPDSPVIINDYANALKEKVYATGVGEIKYSDSSGVYVTHLKGNNVYEWALAGVEVTSKSSQSNVRVETGNEEDLPLPESSTATTQAEKDNANKGIQDAVQAAIEKAEDIKPKVEAQAAGNSLSAGFSIDGTKTQASDNTGSGNEKVKYGSWESEQSQTIPGYEASSREGYFTSSLGYFNSQAIEYVSSEKLTQVSAGKSVSVTITEPSWCGACRTEINALSQQERQNHLYLTTSQAERLGWSENSVPTTIQIKDGKIQ